MKSIVINILALFLLTIPVIAQDNSTTDVTVDEAQEKSKGFFQELFMFKMAADVIETRQIISNNELGDSVEGYMSNHDNALFFISTLDYDFFWNKVLGRKKYKVPSSKIFLESKDKYLNDNEVGSSIDFDIVLTPHWENPATEDKLKDYTVKITPSNYTGLSFSSDEKENLNTIFNSPFTKTYTTPKDAEVNDAVFKGLAELHRLLGGSQNVFDIKLGIAFKNYTQQLYGFDQLTYDVHKPSYQLRDYNSNSVYAPWKSIVSSGIDQVLVEITDNDASFSPGDVKFKTASGTQLSATKYDGKDNLFLLNLNGKTDEQTEEIIAYVNYKVDSDTEKEVAIGGLNTISYDKQNITVVIVPVNGPVGFSAEQFTTKLNEIYKTSVVDWKVTLDKEYTIAESEWDEDGDHKMNDGESTFLSNYSNEQKAFKKKYKQDRGRDKNSYYVFILNNIPSKSGLAGYMPMKEQYAFVHSATNETAAQLIAHELGHGVFRLWHTFSSESSFFMAQKSSDNLMDYNKGTRLHKYQWDKVHNPDGGFYMFQDEDEVASIIDAITIIKGVDYAYLKRCTVTVANSNENSTSVIEAYKFVGKNSDGYIIGYIEVQEIKDVYPLLSTDPEEVILIFSGETLVEICEPVGDYSGFCELDDAASDPAFLEKFETDVDKCRKGKSLELLQELQPFARQNQKFELSIGGKVYTLENDAVKEEIASNADINAGNWDNSSIDMKMRISFNADGVLQFTALGIRQDLPIVTGKTASLTEISGNMLVKNNALLKEYSVKDILATPNSVGANLDSEAFPDGKKVAIDKQSTFIKILCEAGGVGLSFLKTAEIEQPVYLASETSTTIKAPPIGTGALEAGAMAVTDITSMVTTIHDLVTDKQARTDAVAGLKAIKDQVVDQPTVLFPILGEVALQELTGTGKDGYKEMLNGTTDEGRKGHLITKTSVRTTVSVFTSGKFLAKLPDMAIEMAKKMPKAKLWLKFRNISDDLAESLLTKFDELADGGNKFLDDFVGASDGTLEKFLNKPELIDSWKKMDNLGADDALRQNTGALEALAKPNGSRPNPGDYLDADYIENHLNKFDDGVGRVSTRANFEEFGTLGGDNAFVLPEGELRKILDETGGNVKEIEKRLGMNPGDLGENPVFGVFERESLGELKMPTGNGPGANNNWIPGGKTSGGTSEATVNLIGNTSYVLLN